MLSLSAVGAFADPPSRAARLKYISGEVSIQPGGVNDWVAAVVNRPLTTSDRLWTDKNSRAELNLGGASLRANSEASMTLTNVGDEIVQVELDQGTLNLHIRHLFDGETYEIDTPNLAFTILKGGDYRFDVDPNADTTYVTVWHGEGEATGQGPGVKLHSNQQASFTGGTSLQHQMYRAPDRDGFDDWCKVRSDREDHAESYRYVSADVIGADDLDEYGTWRTEGEYGPVWVPRVAPGWAPYHYGHWVWVEPWGWTWVDDQPWGFAPCHYGRWVFAGGFWGWSPGPPVVAVRPVYAPALVAWVGGAHFGVGIAVGGGPAVGWFPLGWGEPYVPAYSVSRNYFQQVNVTNTHITNITNVTNNYYVTNNNTTVVNNNINNIHYVNQNVSGAVTAVPQRSFANSEPVAKNAMQIAPGQLKTVSVASAAPVAPVRNSVLGVNAGRSAMAPPQQANVRPVVSKAAPPTRPIPFEAKQQALAANPGRPLDAQTEATLRTNVARETTNQPNRGATQPMHPGPIETPTGMQPHPANPAPKPGTPAVASAPSTPLPAREVPRPPQPARAPEAEASRTSQPLNTATPATPARVVPRPPSAGGSLPTSNLGGMREAERTPAVSTERNGNTNSNNERSNEMSRPQQQSRPEPQQVSHNHAAPFEQARPEPPKPVPHPEPHPPQHEGSHSQQHESGGHEHGNR
jgi:hypothetical protein